MLLFQERSSNNNKDEPQPSENQQSSTPNKQKSAKDKGENMVRNENNLSDEGNNTNYSNNQSSNNCQNPIVKLPLTMVGNVVLTKGMYLTLMKRREQKAFGNTSYSSTPRLQTTQNRLQINKQYSSCARINAPQYSKYNHPQTQHNFKVSKSTKAISKKQKHENSKENEYQLRSLVQSDKGGQYQEIHKTKRIKKESCAKSISDKRRRRKQSSDSQNGQDSLLRDITDSCQINNNKRIQNNGGKTNGKQNKENIPQVIPEKEKRKSINKSTNQNKKKKSVQSKQEQLASSKLQISSMRERSKLYQKENGKNPQQNSRVVRARGNAKVIEEEFSEDIQDKENQMGSSNISQQSSSRDCDLNKQNDIYNPFQGMQELKYSNIWHQEALDMQTERAMFIQKIKKDKKKKYSQSPKRIVPGYRVKFETSKSRIFAFNCFRDKDLTIEKQYRDTIDLQQDNDYETDCEQLKESIFNVFQSLCVAVCEEKINSQMIGQTQSSIN